MTEEYSSIYVGGEWQEVSDSLKSRFPYTQEPWSIIPRCTEAEVDWAVDAARDALVEEWGDLSRMERGRLLDDLANRLTDHSERIAMVETHDNGKPISESRGMAEAIPEWFEFYGSVCQTREGEARMIAEKKAFVYTEHEPIGVMAAITPYNSPLLLATWKIAPALAAGATVVLKPSERTSASALEFAKCVDEVGFPPGAVNVVTGTGAEVGAPLSSHQDVDIVSFTGGTDAGRSVASSAGSKLIPSILELGGKSANIVFEDADLERCIPASVAGMFKGTGQSCTAGSRLFVQDSLFETVVEKVVERVESITLGDPRQPETEMGPLTSAQQVTKVERFLQQGLSEGATCEYGGERLQIDECNLFFEPTVLSGVRNENTIAQEEVFGPVLSIIPFRGEADVVEMANDSRYGLAAGIWSEDFRLARRVASQLDVGRVWINMYKASSYAAPQGGRKASGYGVENGIEAVASFTKPKSVWVNMDEDWSTPYE